MLAVSALAWGPHSYAEITKIGENSYFYTSDEPDFQNVMLLLNFRKNPSNQELNNVREKLNNSQFVLLLSDGYFQNTSSLVRPLQQYLPKTAQIFRTDFMCQKNSEDEVVTHFQIDNQNALPFRENTFETILMRKGLCLCKSPSTITCGGLRMDSEEDATVFLSSIATILNKKNPSSYAFLHGFHGPTSCANSPGTMNERSAQEVFEKVIQKIRTVFPTIDIRMMYGSINGSRSRKLCTRQIPEFFGIQMKVNRN